MYWLQVYAYYKPVIFTAGKEISLTPINGDQAQNILVTDIEGIDAESSPLRFRACFNTVQSLLILTETYNIYDNPTPLVTPNWFSCFDPAVIEQGLQDGRALAFLGKANITQGFDRVVVVFDDGRGFSWHQLNADLKE
jgi:hypothetical protein